MEIDPIMNLLKSHPEFEKVIRGARINKLRNDISSRSVFFNSCGNHFIKCYFSSDNPR